MKETNTEIQLQVKALAVYLGRRDINDIKESGHDHYGLPVFEVGSEEYSVGTEEQAQDAAKTNIKDSIWAFNASFILEYCGLPLELESAIKSFQEEKCESANDALLALVEKWGLDGFVEKAISSDGRGHFLSPYDGGENEIEVDGQTFFVYRVN